MKEQSNASDSLLYPFLFVAILWLVKIVEVYFHLYFGGYGIIPRTAVGLVGIVTGPLIHINFVHLFSNSLPLLILGILVFNFYRKIAFEIFIWIYLLSGLCVWIIGKPGSHIGASGLVYGFASFIFFSGFFRRNFKALLLSLLIVIVYGSIVSGLLPSAGRVSWQTHLYGAMVGAMCAFFYRNE
ncbi:MAG TPA: rhomboid family intramembrane serine protease [Cytophagaceae bacterium]|nr:rhomboid family intramembrane serine protease [Cytophagaceae bacterium]